MDTLNTPDVIYSRTFDGSYLAFASWARFREREGGASFRVVNVHVDFRGGENRRRSIELVARRVAPGIEAGERVSVSTRVRDEPRRRGAFPMPTPRR